MISKFIYLIPEYLKKKFLLLSLIIFIGSLLEMIGIGLVFPIIAVFSSENLFYEISSDFGLKRDVVESILRSTGLSLVQFLITLFFFVFTLRTIFLVGVAKYQINYILNLYLKLSSNIFKNYLSKDYSFFFKNNSAILIRNISGETSTFSTYVVNGIINLISDSLLLIFILSLLLTINFEVTLYIVLITSLVGSIIYFSLKKKISIASYLRQDLEGNRQKNLQTLYNIKEIKISKLEQFFYSNFTNISKKLKNVNNTFLFFQILPRYLIEFFSIFILAIVIFVSSQSLDDKIVPLLAVYAASAFRILPSLNRILQNLTQINFGYPTINTLYETYKDTKENKFFKPPKIKLDLSSIELKNLYFSYENREKLIFNNINFKLNKGDFVGIVGPSGSGKSSFVNLLCGIIPPTKGDIIINENLRLKEISEDFLNITGYLSQNTSLFDDTIKNNICLTFNDKFDEKKYNDVLNHAQLEYFVQNLPLKSDTIVGENGITLSGGQKQRIGIARALYKNPELLIFDEPTSSLDKATSDKIIQIIKDLSKSKTIILITHDEKLVNNCNKIIRLDGKGNLNEK